MLDLSRAEGFIRKCAERKREVVYVRLAWFLMFMIFLMVAAGVDLGDLLVLGTVQLLFFLVLFLPEQQARGHLRLQALAVVDFILLVLGLGISSLSSVPVLLFLTSFYLACYLSRNLRTLVGITLSTLALAAVLGFQGWFRWTPMLPAPTTGYLLLVEFFLLSLAVYLAFLGLPSNPLLSAHEKYRGALQSKKALLDLMGRISSCRSLKEILAECVAGLAGGIPGSQVDVILIKEKKGGVWNPAEPEAPRDEFSVENIPNLKKALTSPDPVISLYAAEKSRVGAGSIAGAGDTWTEIYFPAFYDEDKEYGHCFRIILTHRSLSGRLQQAQRDNHVLSAMRDLLARLNTVQEIDDCLDATHNVLYQVVGHDSIMLFFSSAGGSLLELAELRSRTPLLFERGFTLPSAHTLVGEAIRRRKITYKGSLKAGDGPETGPDDVHHYLRNNIQSLFILPLAENESALPYGAMILAHRTAGHFQMDQMEILAQLQGPLGLCIRRCLAHRSDARKILESDALQALGAAMTAGQTPENLAQEISAVLERTMPYEHCRLYLYNPAGEQLCAPPSESEGEGGEPTCVSARAKDFVAHVYRTQNGYWTGNTAKDPYSDEAGSLPASRMAVPILFQEEVLGVLDATTYRENAFTDADPRFLGFVAALSGLALANARMAQKFERQTALDPLTHLFNRQFMLERLEVELAQHIRRREPLAVLLADVDGMEQLNLDYGYGTGDLALLRVGEVVRAHCRKGDVPARWEGDCLGMILVGADLAYALKLGQKIGEAIKKHPDLESLKVSLSIGTAAFPQHGQTASTVIAACRQSLERAREQGPDSLAYPETETYLISGRSVQLNTAALYREILGPAGAAGPHTRETLSAMIDRLQEMGCDGGLLGDVLSRLVTKLDYPDRHQEVLTMLPEVVRRLGLEMSLNEQKLRYLSLAYKVYDVGKFTVPQDILYAPRVLSDVERQAAMNHVNVAVQDILNPHKVFAPLLAIVKFHHERWDGSGYPWKLKQEEIPLEARILGLVDVFKALATDRPYRARRPVPEALDIIRKMKNTLFETVLVDALLHVVEDLKIV
jgi:diguanylate cyclase (GGDEF)-like protein